MEKNNIALFCQDFEIDEYFPEDYFNLNNCRLMYWCISKKRRIIKSKSNGFKFGLVVKSIKQK